MKRSTMKYSLSSLLGVAALSATVVTAQVTDPASRSDDSAAKSTPSTSSTPSSSATQSVRGTNLDKIDLNTADAATLQRLPGVNAATASAIIAARPFKSVDDLSRVKEVGEARLMIIKDQLMVSKSDTDANATASSTASTATPSTTGAKTDDSKLEPTGRPSEMPKKDAPHSPPSPATAPEYQAPAGNAK